MPNTILGNFGVKDTGGAALGMLQPKQKHKFRVRVFGFGPPTGAHGLDLTAQVVSVDRPTVSSSPVAVHAYNSIMYYASKPEWQDITLVIRDDITNAASKLVSYQEQKQMNHFQQTSAAAGSQYKFQMFIETFYGAATQADAPSTPETWQVDGCFLSQINYGDFAYDSSDAMTISMTIRYDNAVQLNGLMPTSPTIPSSASQNRVG